CVAVIVGVVAIATLRSTRIYQATGTIAINKMDPLIFNIKEGVGSGMAYDDPTDLDTEVRILRSDLLALQVIRELNLDKRQEYGGQESKPAVLGQTTDALQLDSAKTTALLGAFKSRLTVSLIPGTRIIEIRFRSPDSNQAAQVVNT